MTGEAWPVRFTIGYLARRAGISRFRMRRWVLEFPSLVALMRKGRWTYLTKDDLRRLAPSLFDAVVLGRNSEDEQEAA